MSWSEVSGLAWRAVPALAISLLVTAVLVILGWLALVEGLQGSDFVLLHIFEVLFQGKEIGARELSLWRIIFGMAVIFAGALFWMASTLAIGAKVITEAMAYGDEDTPDDGSAEDAGQADLPGTDA